MRNPRLTQEQDDLTRRLNRLTRFIESDAYAALPGVEQQLLLGQFGAMSQYHAILARRLARQPS